MSNNMDKDISNMDEINALMEDLFAADETATTMVEAVSNEIKKWDGSLEKFSEDDFVRREQLQEWLETDRTGRAPTPPYESMFDGVGQAGLNGLNNQTIQGSDKVIFEKDEMNSSLAGVKNVTGIEDIQDFFTVPHDAVKGKFASNIQDIDEQMDEIRNLPEGDKRELDQEFVDSMGMDLNRLRKIAGATSAWKEIASIKRELKELSSQANKLSFRFNEFIDIYVKDKIPK